MLDKILNIGNNRTKRIADVATIDGPDGVSNSSETQSPPITARIPKKDAAIAIASGERASCLAVAAGIINREVIRSNPTIRMETATTIVINKRRSSCEKKVRTFSANARSSLMFINRRDDQLKDNTRKTMLAPT